jgi:hypothetical protein
MFSEEGDGVGASFDTILEFPDLKYDEFNQLITS